MSRARPIGKRPDGTIALWVDTNRDGQRASPKQLEYLAALEDVDVDDLLDEQLTQGQALLRLRMILGEGGVPAEVEARREAHRIQRTRRPPCRICGKLEDSTKHHFLPRWLMRELSNYKDWADRRRCTIPVCRDCHDLLHDRTNGERSIALLLEPEERKRLSQMIEQLRRERPVLFDLLKNGDRSVYESCLIQDWLSGLLDR